MIEMTKTVKCDSCKEVIKYELEVYRIDTSQVLQFNAYLAHFHDYCLDSMTALRLMEILKGYGLKVRTPKEVI